MTHPLSWNPSQVLPWRDGLAYGLLVIGTIALWWRSCMKRPEYQEYED